VQPLNEWLTQPGGLAYRLKQLRLAAGLDQTQLAAAMRTSQAKVSRLEGRRLATEDEIRAWAQATDPGALDELLQLRRQGEIVHQTWEERIRADAAVQMDYDALYRDAKRIRSYQVMAIPGIVQTPGYARAVLEYGYRINGVDPDPARIGRVVEARMQRQQVLYEGGKDIDVLFTAAAMYYAPCPAPVMADQLDRLMTATHLSSVTIGIIPPGYGLGAVPQVGVLIADDVTIVETPASEDVVHDDKLLAVYGRYADEMSRLAVRGDEARRLITAAADDLRRS
jgi:transcriptional regulator with XRE-family HTH domain